MGSWAHRCQPGPRSCLLLAEERAKGRGAGVAFPRSPRVSPRSGSPESLQLWLLAALAQAWTAFLFLVGSWGPPEPLPQGRPEADVALLDPGGEAAVGRRPSHGAREAVGRGGDCGGLQSGERLPPGGARALTARASDSSRDDRTDFHPQPPKTTAVRCFL